MKKASFEVIKGTNVKGEVLLGVLLLGAVLAFIVFILFMVLMAGTEWFWGSLTMLLQRISFW